MPAPAPAVVVPTPAPPPLPPKTVYRIVLLGVPKEFSKEEVLHKVTREYKISPLSVDLVTEDDFEYIR